MSRLMGSLQRSRTCLATPKKRTLDELKGNKFAVSGILLTTLFFIDLFEWEQEQGSLGLVCG